MRESKFRAWDNVKDEMYYVGEEGNISFGLESNGIVAYDITEEEEFKVLHHLQYMQYTGLNDKNGNLIYEGDILKCPEFYEIQENQTMPYCNWLVTYEKCAFFLEGELMAEDYEWISEECEVIGNKFENPELIKGADEE